ncbi:hypothetical protein [Segetibacter aerophilus]|uniref:Uncharacterized protein n=1 Tax=Segetibacter aerophilus TaxID=670293 RepID=A0A512BHW9_9BACT|nr:hypothetical protein [Segetibacter aerophilus]GEO11552.1 hypothetical protein SAE01_40480 [Segetibacter aerophilus]
MTQVEMLEILKKRPSIHELYYGAFIQEPLLIKKDLFAIPLKPLGFASQANYLAQYTLEIGRTSFDEDGLNNLIAQGVKALPVIAIVCLHEDDASPQELEIKAKERLDKANRILSWASGDNLTPFGILTLTKVASFFRLIVPHSNSRLRLGFGNTGKDFQSQISNLTKVIEEDEHFYFGISIFQDALREVNPQFKVAKFFSCLECFAYRIKSKERPSRKAVKYLLGLEQGAISEVVIDGNKYIYDVIEIAGRVRDKLFHGVQFTENNLIAEAKGAIELYDTYPHQIASSIQNYCELEIARWSNGTSRGLKQPD